MVKLVVFDWAGTMIDYGCFAPVEAFRKAFLDYGIKVTTDEIRQPMGMAKIDHIASMLEMPRIKESFTSVYEREVIQEDIEKINNLFESNLYQVLEDYTDLIDGVVETIASLKERGIKIGSTTGYTSDMMNIVVEKAKEKGYSPDYVSTAQIAGKGRPSSLMIEDNMRYFNIEDPSEVIKVGDTIADILEGKNANVYSVGVIVGSSMLGKKLGEEISLEDKKIVQEAYIVAGADLVIDKISDIINIIK